MRNTFYYTRSPTNLRQKAVLSKHSGADDINQLDVGFGGYGCHQSGALISKVQVRSINQKLIV